MSSKLTVSEGDAQKRLDIFLSEVFGDVSRSQIKNHIDKGLVLVDGCVVKAGHKLRTGNEVECDDFCEEQPGKIEAQELPVEVLFEDDDIVVVNKAQGMVVHPGSGNKNGTLVNALLFCTKIGGGEEFRPGIVHRLDKNTSGVLVVAKNLKAHENLARQIKERQVYKEYVAVCHGEFKQLRGTIETNIARHKKDRTKMAVARAPEGKVAVTEFEIIKQNKKFAYIKFVLQTGRTHQIRVHASYIGHNIVGDDVYGSGVKVKGSLGQLLHAHRLEFAHPKNGKKMSFEAKIPDYFQEFLDKNL